MTKGSFRDINGNMKPNNRDTWSVNPTTFNVAYFLSFAYKEGYFTRKEEADNKKLITNKYTTNGNTWRTNDFDKSPDWSLDEKISALAFFSVTGDREWIKKIPIFTTKENSSFYSWFRPDVLAFTLKVKYPWLPILSWVVLIKIYISYLQFKKNPLGESSGIQLGFIMLMGMSRENIIDQYEGDIKQAMDIYYPQEDHPIRLIWEGLR